MFTPVTSELNIKLYITVQLQWAGHVVRKRDDSQQKQIFYDQLHA